MNYSISNILIYEIIRELTKENDFIENFCPQIKKENATMFIFDFYMNIHRTLSNNTIELNNMSKEFLNKYDSFFTDKSRDEIGEKCIYLFNKIQTLISKCESANFYNSMFEELIKEKHKTLQDIKYHPDSDKIAVIVDPRYDSLMESVIINFMHFMNPKGWNLLIVSHAQYKDEIAQKIPNALFYNIDESQIIYDSNKIPNIKVGTYNEILLDKSFWNSIPASTIAIFQKDCIMYKMFDDIYNEYDYSGANFYNTHQSYIYGGINGGFSIRKKSAMIECIDKVTWELIFRYNTILHNFANENISGNNTKHDISVLNEDVFFTCACEILKKNVPDIIHRKKIAIEAEYDIETSIYHGWNKNYHNIEKAKEILKKSPLFGKYVK
jgi:hypothetical protein